eukprot:gene8836-6270_t
MPFAHPDPVESTMGSTTHATAGSATAAATAAAAHPPQRRALHIAPLPRRRQRAGVFPAPPAAVGATFVK